MTIDDNISRISKTNNCDEKLRKILKICITTAAETEVVNIRKQVVRAERRIMNCNSSSSLADYLGYSDDADKLPGVRKNVKIWLHENGNNHSPGMPFIIRNPKYYPTFEKLLDSLASSRFGDIPNGVRYLFTLDGYPVTCTEMLEDGESYVCSSTTHFKRLNYKANLSQFWNSGVAHKTESTTFNPPRRKEVSRFIVVIKAGKQPRLIATVKIRRQILTSTVDKVLLMIDRQFNAIRDPIKALYDLDFKQVTKPSDLFKKHKVFLAYNETQNYCREDFKITPSERQFISTALAKNVDRTVITARNNDCWSDTHSCDLPANSSTPSADVNALKDDVINVHKSSPTMKSIGEQMVSPINNGSRSWSPASSGFGGGKKMLVPSGPSSFKKNLFHIPPRNDFQSGEKSRSLKARGKHMADTYSGPAIPPVLIAGHKLGPILVQGDFVTVRGLHSKANPEVPMVLKIIDKRRLSKKEQKSVTSEVEVLRCAKHQNILQMIRDVDTPNTLFMVMELVKSADEQRSCDIFDAFGLELNSQYNELTISLLICQLLYAVRFLHANNIVHRNIKPENILVYKGDDDKHHVKLGDFGLATFVDDKLLYEVCGTPCYLAPEMLSQTGYHVKADIWSIGVLTYILLCGFPPFAYPKSNCEEVLHDIKKGEVPFPSPAWNNITDCAKDVMLFMLDVDPSSRASVDEALDHPWIARPHEMAVGEVQPTVVSQMRSLALVSTHQIEPSVALLATTAVDGGTGFVKGQMSLCAVDNRGDSTVKSPT